MFAQPRLTLGNVKTGGCVGPDEARDDLSWWHICHTGLHACQGFMNTMGQEPKQSANGLRM